VTRRLLTVTLIVLLGLGAASCAGQDQVGTAAHRMSTWVKGTGLGEFIGTLKADNARVPKENGAGALHAACGTMEDDADMANDELPSPDSQVTAWLATAYGLEGAAANECYSGAGNPKALAKSAANAAKAEALFSRVVIRIDSIDGRLPSTTTTTDNGPISIFG
jgi:hypothetical protein